jgi:hypothetical protein
MIGKYAYSIKDIQKADTLINQFQEVFKFHQDFVDNNFHPKGKNNILRAP